MPAPLQFTLDGDLTVIVTRQFDAPPELVYRAHTDCALIQRWMIGPPGWSMPRCEMDARPGGTFRHDFAGPEGQSFSILGEFIEMEPTRRLLHVEHMLLPDRTPDNTIETLFEATGQGTGQGTKLTARMTLPDAKARTAMLATGMTDGMEMAYASLDALLGALEKTEQETPVT